MSENDFLKQVMFALLEENRKYKAAFMSLLGDDVCNSKFGNSYNDSYCEVCALQKIKFGGCSKDLNTDFAHDTCAEELFKYYVENTVKK